MTEEALQVPAADRQLRVNGRGFQHYKHYVTGRQIFFLLFAKNNITYAEHRYVGDLVAGSEGQYLTCLCWTPLVLSRFTGACLLRQLI